MERKRRNKPESEQKQPEDYKMLYSDRRGHYPLPPTLLPPLSLSLCKNTINLFICSNLHRGEGKGESKEGQEKER